MDEIKILQKWIDDGEKIAFWGASRFAVGLMRDLLSRFQGLKPVGVFDNFVMEKAVNVDGRVIPVLPGKHLSSYKNYKIILCILKRESRCVVQEYLMEEGLTDRKNYIDGYACGSTVGAEQYPYEIIHPKAYYAPWRKDMDFFRAYEAIQDSTMVDLYRCYELWQLLLQTGKCSGGDVLEVGVFRGVLGDCLHQRFSVPG